ncbi:MAG: MlaD family protein [Proteobacteria bacterium]|nr:MlaD family protein [Pseudomonadota bacterium]
MKRKAHPTRIGLFLLGGVALLAAAVYAFTEGRLFAGRERALAHFEGSVYGLQVGAPVVFRGVRLGSVVEIGVVYQGQPGRYAIPVVLEIERARIDDVKGHDSGVTVADLVAQGLSAQLGTQSLLTGLLYVDLDLRAPAPGAAAPPQRPPQRGDGTLTEIPTLPSPVQALQKQLRNLDFEKLVSDVSAVAAGARQLVANPRLQTTLDELASASGELRQLLAHVNQRSGVLTGALQSTLAETREAAARWAAQAERAGDAVDRVGRAADGVSGTMARVDRAADAAQPMLQSVQRAADDLARTAAALQSATTDDAGLLPQFERATQDIARASRAVRDLADLLQRQPEALLRGRAANP